MDDQNDRIIDWKQKVNVLNGRRTFCLSVAFSVATIRRGKRAVLRDTTSLYLLVKVITNKIIKRDELAVFVIHPCSDD